MDGPVGFGRQRHCQRIDQLELNLPQKCREEKIIPLPIFPLSTKCREGIYATCSKKTGGKIAGPGGAAEILGLIRTSLYARMRTLGMTREE
jgi:hypothetical protein